MKRLKSTSMEVYVKGAPEVGDAGLSREVLSDSRNAASYAVFVRAFFDAISELPIQFAYCSDHQGKKPRLTLQ